MQRTCSPDSAFSCSLSHWRWVERFCVRFCQCPHRFPSRPDGDLRSPPSAQHLVFSYGGAEMVSLVSRRTAKTDRRTNEKAAARRANSPSRTGSSTDRSGEAPDISTFIGHLERERTGGLSRQNPVAESPPGPGRRASVQIQGYRADSGG